MNNSDMIIARNIGKAFRIYSRKRDRLKQLIGKRNTYFREHWALREVDLTLERGEALGIVGRNGSGKSTLLQIISGTLTPTLGNIKVNGKIAALLELGSGFNPDFTGRENIYLNASLFGLSKCQTNDRIDQILSFADIGEFVDQPVRTYSSGMVVRLAFSVITNVDADILVVDEALAVGDAYFTQKCMRFIQRFREEGSLLFVSHDANTVLSLCDRAILLDNGMVKSSGSPKYVIEEYTKELQQANASTEDEACQLPKLNSADNSSDGNCSAIAETMNQQASMLRWSDYRSKLINSSALANKLQVCRFQEEIIQRESFGGIKASISSVKIHNIEASCESTVIVGGEVVRIQIDAYAKEQISNVIIGFILKNSRGLALLGDNTLNAQPELTNRTIGKGCSSRAAFTFTMPMLPAGEYSVSVSVAEGSQTDHTVLHWLNDALILRSSCTNIAAGIAGVAMHEIELQHL